MELGEHVYVATTESWFRGNSRYLSKMFDDTVGVKKPLTGVTNNKTTFIESKVIYSLLI